MPLRHATIRMWPCLPKSMPCPHSMSSNNNPTTLIVAMVAAEDAVAVDVHAAHAVVELVEPQCLLPFCMWGPTSRTSPREQIHLPGNVTQISPTSSKHMPIRMCVTCAVLMWKIGTRVPRATKKAGPSGWFHSFQLHGIRVRESSLQLKGNAQDNVPQQLLTVWGSEYRCLLFKQCYANLFIVPHPKSTLPCFDILCQR